jgi:hypothetical protein
MCTGFIKRGRDVVFGFNMDLSDGLWDFSVCPKKDAFYVGIRVNGKLYKTHGVNARGQFANMPYMNAPERGAYRRGRGYRRLDLLVSGYISGKLDYPEVRAVAGTKKLVNAPGCSMHSLFGDAEGHMLLAEPGFDAVELTGDHAVISNFPILEKPENLLPENEGWYGRDRFRKAEEMLAKADASFGLSEGMKVLEAVSQTQPAPTRVSFVYSVKTRTLRYALERDFAGATEYKLSI